MQHNGAKSCAATQSRADRHKKKLSDRSPRRRARRLRCGCLHHEFVGAAQAARILKGEASTKALLRRHTARWRQCSVARLLF